MTVMDIWLMLCMGIIFFAVAEYTLVIGMSIAKMVINLIKTK